MTCKTIINVHEHQGEGKTSSIKKINKNRNSKRKEVQHQQNRTCLTRLSIRKTEIKKQYVMKEKNCKAILKRHENITAKSVTISVIHMPGSRPFDKGGKKVACLPVIPAFRFSVVCIFQKNIACTMSIWGIIFENQMMIKNNKNKNDIKRNKIKEVIKGK